MKKKVIIIGAGAAGLIAAGKAAECGKDVLLLEKNDQVGKKLLITGKGRCNLTNDTDVEGLIRNIPGNGNFLYSSFYTFSNNDLLELLHKEGLKTKVERGGRVFAESDKAKDVVHVLRMFAEKRGAIIKLNAPVASVETENGRVLGVRLKDGSRIEASSVVLATGGASYPGTGSTGDGYRVAESLGHKIIPLKPSLIPLIVAEKWVKELQGLSLKNISVAFIDKAGRRIYNDFGEMLFTHYGVSGPVILSGSRHILKYDYRNVKLVIDLKPALNEEVLDERLQRDFGKYSRKQFKNSLLDLLPQKMIPVIIMLSQIHEDKFVNQITKSERKELVRLLKNFTLEITGSRPISEAIVTAGGICTDEMNPSTMESKLIKGLYMAGEVIDVDGYTGGFNLTIAFSTGYIAGMNC